MPLKPQLQLVGEMPRVDEETCLNFVHFRNILKAHRSLCDDKIRQRLSSISDPKEQCSKFLANLLNAQESRKRNLNFCLDVLNAQYPDLNKKEIGLLESEIVVEEIQKLDFIGFFCSDSPVQRMQLKKTFTVLYCPVSRCDRDSPFYLAKELLEHLKDDHGVLIYEPDGVEPFLDQYLERCKSRLNGELKVLGGLTDEEDKKIRRELHTSLLNNLLETQQHERNTIYKQPRMCLFCSFMAPILHDLFSHMFQEHHFNIGLLDNLIFVDTFLNELEEMNKFKKECLYCHEQFRNGTCLRKHLKSKRHFKIDAKDERWDRFYLINYVNFLKPSASKDVEDENDAAENEDAWDDLTDEIDSKTQCLFCDDIFANPEFAFEHMKNTHLFDLKATQRCHNLKFYDTMKLVNYLRNCQRNDTALPRDLFVEMGLPDSTLWNRPEFYFPVYEEDPLLTAIGEPDSEDDLELEDEKVQELENELNKL